MRALGRLSWLAWLLASGLLPRAAGAQTPEEAAVAGERQRLSFVAHAIEPELEPVAARAGAAARAALRGEANVAWEAADQRLLGYDAIALDSLQEARRLLADGRTAYLELRLDDAITALGRSVDAFDAAIAALEDTADLGDALLLLGAAHQLAGHRRVALRIFRRLQVQMPQRVPDPEIFPPQVIEAWQRVAPRSRDTLLRVTSDPPGGVVYVDFVPRGVAPLTVRGLAEGAHFLRVTRPGSVPYIEVVDTGRRPVEVEAVLFGSERDAELADAVTATRGQDLVRAEGPVQALGRRLDLDRIGVIRVGYGDDAGTVALELVVFDVRSGRRLYRMERSTPRALGIFERLVRDAVSASVAAVLREPLGENPAVAELPAAEVVSTAPAEEARTPLRKRWWLWASVGAVIVGAVAVGVALRPRDEGPGRDTGGQVVFEF